ncbi:kinase-like domain-containing protein [Podospora fimiseda]|uniref:Serine/threonine-protein kinase BUR1 n=1 Tax=Podospora fimiseda TaxID=252190 RepID=A0AAN7H288_9PEZI|nr:kinase-like domain-containing protein [Podospora fimiseda]
MSIESRENSGNVSPRSFAIAHQRPRHEFVGCSKIAEYEVLGKLGEGTFGEVHRARSRRTGALVALKKIIMHNEKDGFPITALREIKILKMLSHPNILRLEDMSVEHPARHTSKSAPIPRKKPIMYMVTPYMDHDLSGLLDNPSVNFTEPQIKCYMIQLLKGVQYLHENHILHRDMKAANLLINNKGILQIADFGLARHYDGDVPQPGCGGGSGRRDYTSLVVTRWYRPPELLMHLKAYTTAIDMWGVGCVFGEMLVGKPILSGNTDAHQLELIFDLCGTPTLENMPSLHKLPAIKDLNPQPRQGNLAQRFSKHGSGAVSLLRELLKLDWITRINAIDALSHPYFRNEPLPAKPEELPSFEESHELDRRKFQTRREAYPPAPKGGTVGRGPTDNPNSSFGADGYGRNGGNSNRFPRNSRGPAEERVPAWQRDRGPADRVALPPRPHPPVDYGNGRDSRGDHPDGYRDRDNRGPRARGGGGGRPDVDTYIPAYDRDAPRRDDRHRERDDRRHDWGGGGGGGGRRDYDDRARASQTRSRSRSPAVRDRDRDRPPRDMHYR